MSCLAFLCNDYIADENAIPYVYDNHDNDVTNQFNLNIQYGRLTILHNPEYDIIDIFDEDEDEIDEYDITIQNILNEMSGKTSVESQIKKYSRKELESLYVDNIQLLSGHGLVNPNYEFMLHERKGTNEVIALQNRIIRDFKDVDLLCQIEISDSEFLVLKNHFIMTYIYNKKNGKPILVDILFSVFLVQLGIRYYHNNFWPHLAEILGVNDLDPSCRTMVGGTVTKTLLMFGKPVYGEHDYVTNILMHSFITDPFANRFFDYIFQYYSIDMERNLSGI